MALDESISRLIGRIYDGAFDRGLWNGAIQEVLQKTESRFALLAVLDTRKHDFSETNYFGRIREAPAREYEAETFAIDPSFDFIVANPRARYFETAAQLPANAYFDHPFVRWCVDNLGTSHWITGYTPEDDGFTFAASFHSDELRSPHRDSQKRLLKMLFEHMERAQRLAARPPDLERSDKALVLIDRRGKVLALNQLAEKLIVNEPGLVMQNRVLRPKDPLIARRWDGLLRSALSGIEGGGAGGSMALPRFDGRRPLLITIDPSPGALPKTGNWQAAAIIRLVDPAAGIAPCARLHWMEMFDLSGAEGRLAEALLVSDCDLRRAARHCGTSYATARTQLANIFRKTGTHGQPALVQLLMQAGIQ